MIRRLMVRFGVSSIVLVLGCWALAATPPKLTTGTYQRVIAADIAQLQASLAKCLESPVEARRSGPTVRALAMILALAAEATGDAPLRDQAVRIAELVGKKDYQAAAEQAKTLKATPGSGPLASSNLHTKADLHLDEVMSPYRAARTGGLNIEKDIRDWIKKGAPAPKPEDVEILAARVALLNVFTIHMPNEKATVSSANKQQWQKWSAELVELSRQLAQEASKGAKADNKNVVRLLSAINAKCTDCHNQFRDD